MKAKNKNRKKRCFWVLSNYRIGIAEKFFGSLPMGLKASLNIAMRFYAYLLLRNE